jgi:transcriptional regulator GlxA family with amidase domain
MSEGSSFALEPASPRRIGLLGFESVAALDLTGVLEAFSLASQLGGGPRALYETLVVGVSTSPFTSESGLRLLPDTTLADCPELDTVVIPGGPGLRRPEVAAVLGPWLHERRGRCRRFVSVCTGVYGLAASGLLDGRRATTHWRHAAHAARSFPRVTFEPDAIFIKDGPCYSSAGMTAGIDLALALIEEDHGSALALAAARMMVVYMKRSGGQLQYSEPLKLQTRGSDRFADLIAGMLGELGADWSVEAMAARAGLSPRQFARRFKSAFGASPAAHLESLRLDESRLRLAGGCESVAKIAHVIGFRSDDAFRRAFERRFGVTPTAYRGRFKGTTAPTQEIDHVPVPLR